MNPGPLLSPQRPTPFSLRCGSIPRAREAAPASEHHLRAPCRRRPGSASPHPRLSRGSRPGSPALALGSVQSPPSAPEAPMPPRRWPRRRDPRSQTPSARAHPISHGPVTFRSLTTGLVRKQTVQLVLKESSSVHRRLLLLLPAILSVSGGSAGSRQRPPPPGLHLLGPALPVVASRAVETVGPPGNYNSRGALRACVLSQL